MGFIGIEKHKSCIVYLVWFFVWEFMDQISDQMSYKLGSDWQCKKVLQSFYYLIMSLWFFSLRRHYCKWFFCFNI